MPRSRLGPGRGQLRRAGNGIGGSEDVDKLSSDVRFTTKSTLRSLNTVTQRKEGERERERETRPTQDYQRVGQARHAAFHCKLSSMEAGPTN